MSGIVNSAGSKSGVIGETELDYETGTWDAANSAFGLSIYQGAYTKIGNICFINVRLRSSGSGAANFFTGLPFTCYAQQITGAAMSNDLDWASNTSLSILMEASSNQFKLYISGDDVGWYSTTTWATSDIAVVSFFYKVA
jgi:hypothetical protein